jgi:hypothetical protein
MPCPTASAAPGPTRAGALAGAASLVFAAAIPLWLGLRCRARQLLKAEVRTMGGNLTLLQVAALLAGLVMVCYVLSSLAGVGPMARIGLSAVFAPVLFQGVNFLQVGHLDPFFGVALLLSLPVCVVAAAVVHALSESFRGRRPD